MSKLLRTKSVSEILDDPHAREGGTSLKRVLKARDLIALGVGAIIGAGIFATTGEAAAGGADHLGAGPAVTMCYILVAIACGFSALCYAEFASFIPIAGSAYTYAYATLGELIAWIIGWDLTLEYAMGASTVSSGWSNHFIEMLRIFNLEIPLWLAYDHWTGLRAAVDQVARQQTIQNFPAILPGSQDFLAHLDAIKSAPSADIMARAHTLLNAPQIFGMEIGVNIPAFIIALVITAILVIGIKESARFNSTIVVVKVGVVLFVLGLGAQYVNPANWGNSWSTFAPYGFSGIGAGAAYIFFAYIGFDAVSTTAQEAKNPQRDLPIAIIASLAVCTFLYIGVAAVLTGIVPWKEVNIEAPIARAFLDRNLGWASNIITMGALAGLTSVMLVMLLGQTRVLYAMAKDGLLPGKFFAAIHPKFHTPYKNTILVGLLAAIVGSVTPIDDIGKMVNIGTLLAFVIVCIAIIVLRKTNPDQPRPFRTPWMPVVPILGVLFNGYMMYKLGWVNWARLIIWLAIGLVIYFMYGRKHSKVQRESAAN